MRKIHVEVARIVFRRIFFGKLVESIKQCSILTLKWEIKINKVNWLLKGIFDTLIWYVIWL
jgi:hypothetical protein